VLGRGLAAEGDRYELTPASQSRVRALVTYIESHSPAFSGRPAQVVFSGGWSESVLGPDPPPAEYREGVLMTRLAVASGLMSGPLRGRADLYTEDNSRNTLENFLCTKDVAPFRGVTFTEANPLGIVAHSAHLKRAAYLARKVFRIRADAIQAIVAEGDDKSALAPEPLMLLMTRIFCLGVYSPARLHQRQRLMNGAVQFFHGRRLSALRGGGHSRSRDGCRARIAPIGGSGSVPLGRSPAAVWR